MNLKKTAIFLMVFLCHFSLIAQESYSLSGTVTSEGDNIPLAGVNVFIKGTNRGVVSDFDGNYEIDVAKGDELRFTYLGFNTVEVIIDNQQQLDMAMSEDTEQLEETIVVGYGTQKKSHLTGAVSKLENRNLEELPYSNIGQALKGKIAGLQIQNTSSDVGEAPVISIRGVGSINASSGPLVVVDGFPYEGGLDFINPASIESVEVLKDASSAAIYGSRGANGVIIITTKEGSDSAPKYEFKTYSGFKKAKRKIDIVDIFEYTDTTRDRRQLVENFLAAQEGREPGNIGYTRTDIGKRSVAENAGITDWQDESLRNKALINNYLLSASGGNKKTKYFISGQYIEDEGLLKDNFLERMNLQTKLSSELSDNFKIGVNMTGSYSHVRRSAINFTDSKRMQSWLPVYHNEYTSQLTGEPEGSYAHPRHFNNTSYDYIDQNGVEQNTGNISLWTSNNNQPISGMLETRDFQDDYRLVTSMYSEWDILDNLQLRTNLGGYFQYRNRYGFVGSLANSDGQAEGTENNMLRTKYILENTLNYKLEFGDHEIDALVGMAYENEKFRYTNVEGAGYATDFIHTLNAATILSLEDTGTNVLQSVLLSYFGRINYSYDNKYLLSMAARADGSSFFGANYKYGVFPSASIGWNIHEENFFNENVTFIDRLKIRTSVGLTGNNDIEYYANTNLVYPANYSLGSGGGRLVTGLGETGESLGNQNLRWEKTIEYDTGIDMAFLNNRLNFSADYYYSISDQLLLKQNISLITGFDSYWNNIGKIQNRGIELDASFNTVVGKFSWRSNANISFNDNKLISFGGQERNISTGERSINYLSRVGDPYIQFYGYKTDGVWQSGEEIQNNPSFNGDVPGSLRVVDVNGDGILSADDRTVLGDPFPDFNWGFTNTFTFKNIDLNFSFQGSQGGKVIYGEGYYQEIANYQRDFFEGSWFNENFEAENPERTGISWALTDYLVQDASYVSLREVILGYSLPANWINSVGVNKLRLYASAQNLLYFTADNYTGLNPEGIKNENNPLITGYQRGEHPVEQQFTVGIEINF
jgi:TonB-linked SusC/RagA family outer membrane protein